MTVGTISTRVLTDIANAIRRQAGTAALLKPGEMAAAVAALDGTDAGGYEEQGYMELETGVLSGRVLEGIAGAIRGQNGLETRYRPGEMAAAILALEWGGELKVRALLLEGGTLEFTYRASAASPSGGTVAQAFDVDPAGYTSAAGRAWDGVKGQVAKVLIDESVAGAGLADCSYWFHGFSGCTEVRGFENLSGITAADWMFTSCTALETIYATGFENAIAGTGTVISGCGRLVGGADCYAPATSEKGGALKLGAGGVLTDPGADAREWCWAHLYDDGEAVITASGEPDQARTLLASGRICANAVYQGTGHRPWAGSGAAGKDMVTRAVFAEDMAGYGCVNLAYLFYACTGLTSVDGLGNLRGTRAMDFAFASTALSSLDLRGFDPSALSSLIYCFASCASLATILADGDWALPGGVTGFNCFYGCKSLVGGNGTAFSSDKAGSAYMRIDREGEPGYLTEA